MPVKHKALLRTCALLAAFFWFPLAASAQQARLPAVSEALKPERAVACEDIQNFAPINEAIVFSAARGKVFCFTSFATVAEPASIYHTWFQKDKLITRRKLSLQPPAWSTYSSIQLREADKGPWRVEITDQAGRMLHVVRFSVTD